MSEENYEKFAREMEERFPKMFSGKYGGFAVGPGWWNLLKHLCHTIQNHIDQNKDCPQVVVSQIKEKFGSLRFYYDGGDSFVDGAVSLAESMAGGLCEECGAPGKRTRGGWVRTLCDFHLVEKAAFESEPDENS